MGLGSTNWNYPTTIWFGNGRINEISQACKKLGIKNPLFVTDDGLVELDIVEKTRKILERDQVPFTVYSDVQGNPTEKNVVDGVAHYLKNKHDGVLLLEGVRLSMRPKRSPLCPARPGPYGILRMWATIGPMPILPESLPLLPSPPRLAPVRKWGGHR